MKSAGKGKLKKIILWAVVGLAVILFVVIPIFGPLNPLEVMLLRIKYPVYSPLALKDPLINFIGSPNLERNATASDSILHIKVTGDEEETYLHSSSGSYCWTAEVIEDASGKFQPGETIWAEIGIALDGIYPHLQKGNEYLVMGGYSEDRKGLRTFTINVFGIFYVTFSRHALASFPEEDSSLSGKKIDVCMDTVYQLIQENAENREALETTEE